MSRLHVCIGIVAALALAAVATAAKPAPAPTCGYVLKDFLLNEQATAGTVTATLELPPASRLLGFSMHGVSDWADTNAHLSLRDENVTYFDSEEAYATDSDSGWFNGTPSVGSRPYGIYYPNGQMVSVTYTTTVDSPAPTGQTRVELIYATGIPTVSVP